MNKKEIIKKILVVTAWMLVVTGITTLLVAANQKQKAHLCNDLMIGMRGGSGMYIEKNDILKLIKKTAGGDLLNRPVAFIDLARLEKALETNPWIKGAELYFDSKDVLHVFVEERQPVARIFTGSGRSFYIDSSGHVMPLLEKLSARVPVVTGFPAGAKWYAEDSTLMDQVKELTGFIYSNEFWNAQVGQVHITADRKFELVPVIGDHVIKIGNGDHVADKLNRLYVFYKQVLSKVGFNKYAVLDVQYQGQVVAVKKEGVSPVDSIQLQRNIEDLMTRAMAQVGDEGMMPDQIIAVKKDSTVSSMTAQTNQVSTKTSPNPILAQAHSNPEKTQPAKSNENPEERRPKAVMKRLEN